MPEQSPPEVRTAKRLGAPSRPPGVEAPEASGEVGREGAGVCAEPGTFLAFLPPSCGNDMVEAKKKEQREKGHFSAKARCADLSKRHKGGRRKLCTVTDSVAEDLERE